MLTGQPPKLVNKQFNSPINLYSPQNIQETLDRQTKMLSNGAVGIDFNQLGKPVNLQNSAVLRMLEEEEARQRNGSSPGLKRVAWPPPEDQDEIDYIKQDPVQAKTRCDFPSYQSSPSSGRSPQPPISSPGGTLRQPSHFQPQQPPNLKAWSPNTPPPTTQLPSAPSWTPSAEPQANYQPQRVHSHLPPFEPPPTTITLRQEPPISQSPAPVYQAQPAATMAPVSGTMRGDMKWPPESVKQQTEAENRARLELAKGPAVRPRLARKDYSGFFAQHALNSTYPGYRAPPGTQYFTPAYQH